MSIANVAGRNIEYEDFRSLSVKLHFSRWDSLKLFFGRKVHVTINLFYGTEDVNLIAYDASMGIEKLINPFKKQHA